MINVNVMKRTVKGKVLPNYYARWTDGEPGLRGRDCWKSLQTADKGEARRRAVALEKSLNEGTVVEKPALRLSLMDCFTFWRKSAGVTVELPVAQAKARIWNEFCAVAAAEGILYLDECSMATGVDYRDHCRGKLGLSGDTTNSYLGHLSSVVNRLKKDGRWKGENPFVNVPRIPESVASTERKKPGYLSPQELSAVVDISFSHSRAAGIFTLLCGCAGMRRSEALHARWGWIEFPSEGRPGKINLPAEEEGWNAKTRKGRTIPLSSSLASALRPFRGLSKAFCCEGLTSPLVEPVIAAWKAAGHDISPHDLRHTFASLLVQAGVSIYKVQRWLGHSSVEMTMRYSHLSAVDEDVELGFAFDVMADCNKAVAGPSLL